MKTDILLHGGALDLMRQRYPEAPSPWLDLSTGINPWPYSPIAVSDAALSHLPTTAQFSDCAVAMANAINTSADKLLLAPGSELLIRLLPTILSARRVAVMSQSYGDHASSWRQAGAELVNVRDPLQETGNVDIIVVCNPNNPDGRQFSREALLQTRDSLAARGGTLIVDEAYADLMPELSLADEASMEGLIVLRSFGKFFGLAGVRLGAMIAVPRLLHAMRERLGVWPVAGPALEIGTIAYRDLSWHAETRQRLSAFRVAVDAVLQQRGVHIAGGTDLFRFVRVADAAGVWDALAGLGIYVRKFNGCGQSLRIGLPSSASALQRLDGALQTINP